MIKSTTYKQTKTPFSLDHYVS